MALLDVSSKNGIAGVLSLLLYLTLAALFYRILCTIACQNARAQAAALASALSKDNTQLELEEEEEDTTTTRTKTNGDYVQASHEGEHDEAEHDGTSPPSSPKHHNNDNNNNLDSSLKLLSREDKIGITLRLSILLLLNYLLLVFVPGGSVVLAFVATAAVWGLTLHPYLYEELWRRRRWDRVVLLVALFVWMAAAATACTYHRLTWQTGTVYAGSARIVGYDTSLYENADEETLRADLQVAWGGSWACGSSQRQCVATVQGALCQAKYNASDYAEDDRRFLAHESIVADDGQGAEEEEEFEEEVVEEAETEVVEYEEEVVEEADEEIIEYEDGTC